MKPVIRARNRLLLRSYLVLAGGLLAVALVLDFGFGQLQDRERSDVDRWLESTLRLIEMRLAEAPAAERDATAAQLAQDLDIGVQLLSRNDLSERPTPEQALVPLVDSDGNSWYLHDAASISAIIRLGPVSNAAESSLLRLLPPLFYLSIFVVVGLWLRPLLKDINVISGAARRFAADYRDPLATADQTTELKPLATNLDEMSARLSGVLRSQKELIAALSHEMRTPLARLRFALAVSGDKADSALKERLAAMNNDVQEVDDLIASMLNYARLDHPDVEMHWQAVPVRPWLEKIVRKAQPKSVELSIDTDRSSDNARMDPRLMELALSNLLSNASKYARTCICCTFSSDSKEYLLSVEDDGTGIPETERERVFKAFTRVDDSRNRGTGGYGLGLAIVARVAELHGGHAAVDESSGLGGACISIRWPRHAD